jgi:methylated-DNA-[protein]-cysteine S-methyltransferase
MVIARAMVPTPIGEMLALDSGEGLAALEFTGPEKRLARLEARLARWFPPHEMEDRETEIIRAVRRWIDAYFSGALVATGDLPLDPRGAAFEKRVWDALRAIPAGETRSYGEMAKTVGSPHASRAVGAANGANPIAIVIPCHRVIGSDGSLTGYGGGLDRKRWLLDHERRWRREAQTALF